LLGEGLGIAVDHPSHARTAAVVPALVGAPMKIGDRGREWSHQVAVELASRGQPIEKVVLVEPGHFDDPLQRDPRAALLQRPVGLPGHRDDAAIEARGRTSVDAHFRLAQHLASLWVGKIE